MNTKPSETQTEQILTIARASADGTEAWVELPGETVSLAFLEAILAHGPAGFALLDTNLRYVRMNRQLAEINGRPMEAHIGRTFEEVFGVELASTREPYFRKALSGESTLDTRVPGIMTPAGRRKEIIASYLPVSVDGQIVGIAAIIRDDTETAAAQAMLSRHSLAFENLFDALVITDIAGIIVDCNTSFLRRSGLPRDALIGRSITMLARPEDRDSLLPFVIEAMRTEGRFAGEIHYVNSTGEVRLAEISAVPLRDVDGSLTGLVAALRDITDRKRAEAALRESQERYRLAAEELTRAYDHERIIAGQLQESLQPHFPDRIPGLAIAHYYRPALEEAEVGGDFADCFPLNDDCTAIAVGDLSGKGLAAAVQVATVRNMLRFAIYNGRSIDEAVMSLNTTLSQFNLVAGFVTLFTACFNAERGKLTYVNCGQESGLVYRQSTDTVVEMPATSPVLGLFPRFTVREVPVDVGVGDVIAIFTDGITEAGDRREGLLGVNGVAGILKKHAAGVVPDTTSAYALVEKIVDEVIEFAGGRLRDDVCLLIAIVGEGLRSNP